MESIKIDILNPKAKKLLQNLADLKLIKIKKSDDRKADYQVSGDDDLLTIKKFGKTKIVRYSELKKEIKI